MCWIVVSLIRRRFHGKKEGKMSPVWVAFFVGLFLGANLGLIVIALCFIARDHYRR